MKLEQLVDDYLAKHEARIEAGQKRHRALREVWPQEEKDAALEAFIKAHNECAKAFRALRDSRKKKR